MPRGRSAESPGFPICPLVLSEGLCTADIPPGRTQEPFWKTLLDTDEKTVISAAEGVISARSPLADQDYLSNVLQQFADWVLDLPASEKHHHACPNGLFRHSAEVASATVLDLQERWRPERGCILPLSQQSLWLKVVFAVGLFHDCGKILDLDVRDSPSGTRWDPLGESLAAFKARHGKAALAPTSYQFRPGRGLTGHEQKGIHLLRVILAGSRWNRLRPLLDAAFAAFVFRHQVPYPGLTVPLGYLAERVHQADVLSTQRDRKKARRLKQLGVACQEAPSGLF